MAMFSDADIKRAVGRGELVIAPYDAGKVQPASYDCMLGETLRIPTPDLWVDPYGRMTDVQQWPSLSMHNQKVPMANRLAATPGSEVNWTGGPSTEYVSGLWMSPGQFLLGHTEEHFEIPDWLSARIEGKSTLGRYGLSVHITAGFVDPGFKGQLTLELKNDGPFHLLLRPGMPIAQVSFSLLASRSERPYGSDGLGSHYQGQMGARPAEGSRGPFGGR